MNGDIVRVIGEVIAEAVELGACSEKEAYHMTARELMGALKARERALVQRMKAMDMLAWLIGQYVAVGVNSPGRYPRQPDRVREKAVGAADMKALMRDMALRGGKEADK